jgi:competence protein ComEC
MKKPFAPVAIFFGLGSLLGLFLPFYPFYFKPFIPALIIFAWFFFIKKLEKVTFILVIAGFFLLGYILSYERKDSWNNNPLRFLNYREYFDLTGTVYKSPERVKNGYNIYLKVNKISYEKKERFLKGNVRLFVQKTEAKPPELYPGDEVLVSAQLTEKGRYSNPESRVERALMIKGIHRTGKVKSPYLIKVLKKGSNWNFRRFLTKIKFLISRKMDKALEGEEREFLKGALLGERNGMSDSVLGNFERLGIYHILAISGLHIGIISLVLLKFFGLLRISERKGYLILILVLIFYAFFLEGKAPIFRASFIIILLLISKLLWKDHYFLNALSLSAFILLLINPHFVIDAGFLLTYSSIYFIAIYTENIYKNLPVISFNWDFLNKIYSKTAILFSMSISATLGTLPIIAFYFNRVVFASIIFNFLIIPLFIFLVYLSIPWLVILLFSWKIASIFSFLVKFPISLIMIISKFHVPSFLSFRVPTPHPFLIFLYFISFSLIPFRKKFQKLAFSTIFFISLILICLHPFPPSSKYFKVSFIDIGPGESFLIEFPGKTKMLIDGGGGMGEYDVGENILSPFLWSKGIKKIDYIVLSHAHPDHIGGLFSIVRNFKIGEVWLSSFPEKDGNFKDFLKLIGSKSRLVTAGFRKEIEGAKLEVFHPERRRVEYVSNEDSMVLKITFGSYSFLFPGDIGVASEKEIIGKAFSLNSYVLKSPHHGSKSSSSEEFLNKVSPEIVVITQGTSPGLPNENVVKRYLNRGIHIFRTQRDGLIEFVTNGREIKWKFSKR